MILLWLVTAVALVVALTAWRQARRTAERLDHVSQMYWELKYQQGELRLQVRRAADEPPAASARDGEPSPTPAVCGAAPGDPPAVQTFVPLVSLKR